MRLPGFSVGGANGVLQPRRTSVTYTQERREVSWRPYARKFLVPQIFAPVVYLICFCLYGVYIPFMWGLDSFIIKGVDTGNAARCILTQSGPKQGVGIIHHSSLYEQILSWVRTYSKGFNAERPSHGSTRLCWYLIIWVSKVEKKSTKYTRRIQVFLGH